MMRLLREIVVGEYRIWRMMRAQRRAGNNPKRYWAR